MSPNLILKPLQNYSFLSDETIFENILKKMNIRKVDDEKLEAFEDINRHLHEYTKYIDIYDVNHILYKLESNIVIIDYALENRDDEISFHLRTINAQNQKFLNEIFTMLDGKELK